MVERHVLHRLCTAALLVALLAAPALPTDAAGPIDQLAGVYRTHSLQARMDGTEYTAENILEFVALTPATAYFRTRVEGSNGHECNLSGVAALEPDSLVYRPAKPFLEGGPLCRLTIRIDGDRLALDDPDDGCHSACGVRASFADGIFPRSARRPIRYLTRLRQSSEFKQALAELRTHPAETPP